MTDVDQQPQEPTAEENKKLTSQELQYLNEFDEEKGRLAVLFLNLHTELDKIKKAVASNDEARSRFITGLEERYHVPRGVKWSIHSDGEIILANGNSE